MFSITRINCFYHSDTQSITKCQICHKLLCSLCNTLNTIQKTNIPNYIGSINPLTMTYIPTQHELCPECYYDKEVYTNLRGIWQTIIAGVICSVWGFVYFITLYITNNYSSYIIPLLILFAGIVVLLGGIINMKVKLPIFRKDAGIKKQKFIDLLQNSNPIQNISSKITNPINTVISNVCYQCGTQNSALNDFCGKCGTRIR